MSQLEAEIRRIVREELAKTVNRLSECSAIRQEAVSTESPIATKHACISISV